ncbi:acyltransferase family protein [Loktanella sp. DJP18]|uniref:acyltransferase family protein n=1 Tax=Loktanella sp. DJP18 TaxID=3409788 RepID=UPI003BB69C39
MSSPQRKSELDGLRCIAVVPVVVAHAWATLLPGGHLGVDIFFVLSGYLIAGLLAHEISTNTFSLQNFYRRRILRLMPAFFVVVVATLMMSWLVQTPSETAVTFKTALASVFSISNLYLPITGGYFSPNAALNPLLHTWSLGVEEQFYLIFPLILFIIMKWAPRSLLPVLTLLAFASLLDSYSLHSDRSNWAHYSPLARAWELLLGAALGTCLAKPGHALRSRLSSIVVDAIAWISLSVILLTFSHSGGKNEFFSQVMISLATAFLIWSIIGRNSFIVRVFRWRFLVWTGLMSYSIYLWHQPIMAMTRLFMDDGRITFLIVTVLASVAFAYLTFRFVEQPARHLDLPLRKVSIFICAFVASLTLLFTYAVETHWFGSRYDQALIDEVVNHHDALKASSCSNWHTKAPEGISFCHIPATRPTMDHPPTVAIWGDSHAMALSAGFISRDRDYGLAIFGSAGCPIQSEASMPAPKALLCSEKHNKALKEILSDPSIRVVLVHSKWSLENQSPAQVAEMARYLEGALLAVKASGRNVIMVSAVPIYQRSPKDAILRQQRLPFVATPRQSIADYRSDTTRMINGSLDVARSADVQVIRSEDVFCPGGECVSAQGGLPLYFDSNHLSILGANLLADAIQPKIIELLEADRLGLMLE